MTQRSLHRIAAAAFLVVVLALATPAHAAGRHGRIAGSGWMESVLSWVTQLWLGGAAGNGIEAPGLKADQGHGIDPDGARTTAQPPNTNADQGHGIDPDG
jgi:hypothetical protein